MPDEPRRLALDLTSGGTLLGEDVPVRVAEVPAEATAALEQGAAVIVVPATLPALPALVEVAAHAMLVVSGPVQLAQVLALDLVAAGAPAGHVVVEAVVVRSTDAPSPAQIEEIHDAGLLVGAVLAAASDGSDEDEGWEIAMCTRLLAVGVQTLRNVDAVRFRRVQAVVESIRRAAP